LYKVSRCLHQMKELNHNWVNSILILNIYQIFSTILKYITTRLSNPPTE
jgi:hypothetical protein